MEIDAKSQSTSDVAHALNTLGRNNRELMDQFLYGGRPSLAVRLNETAVMPVQSTRKFSEVFNNV